MRNLSEDSRRKIEVLRAYVNFYLFNGKFLYCSRSPIAELHFNERLIIERSGDYLNFVEPNQIFGKPEQKRLDNSIYQMLNNSEDQNRIFWVNLADELQNPLVVFFRRNPKKGDEINLVKDRFLMEIPFFPGKLHNSQEKFIIRLINGLKNSDGIKNPKEIMARVQAYSRYKKFGTRAIWRDWENSEVIFDDKKYIVKKIPGGVDITHMIDVPAHFSKAGLFWMAVAGAIDPTSVVNHRYPCEDLAIRMWRIQAEKAYQLKKHFISKLSSEISNSEGEHLIQGLIEMATSSFLPEPI